MGPVRVLSAGCGRVGTPDGGRARVRRVADRGGSGRTGADGDVRSPGGARPVLPRSSAWGEAWTRGRSPPLRTTPYAPKEGSPMAAPAADPRPSVPVPRR